MISPTIVLVVGLALALVSLIVIAVCVIKSMLRPVLRSGMQLVVALACIPIALLLSKLLYLQQVLDFLQLHEVLSYKHLQAQYFLCHQEVQ